MVVDLHNHTTLCNHAKGSMQEYIKEAISQNVDIYGFSDHAPMEFDKKYRMSFDDMKLYQDRVLELKDRYKDEIDIRLGYEVDYLKGYMDKRVLGANVDYLIGSVHFIDGWGFDNPEFIGKYDEMDIDEIWQKYFDTIEEMAKSQLFDIVGHLDLIKVFKFMPTKDIKEIASNALDAIAKANMAIEINSAGLRKPIKEAYPSLDLLKMAKAREIPITFGSDAHSPEQVGYGRDEAYNLAKEAGYSRAVVFKDRKREEIII